MCAGYQEAPHIGSSWAELRASTFGFRGGYVVPCRLGRFDISN
jgi:hypothetical protein